MNFFDDDDDDDSNPDLNNALLVQIKEIVETSVEKVFRSLLVEYGLLASPENLTCRLVSLNQLCQELDVSRQTVHKWQKDEILGRYLAEYSRTIGSRKRYDIESIKRCLITNDLAGNGKEYKYRVAAKSEVFRMKKMISEINMKITAKELLTMEEEVFLQQNSFKIDKAVGGTYYLKQ